MLRTWMAVLFAALVAPACSHGSPEPGASASAGDAASAAPSASASTSAASSAPASAPGHDAFPIPAASVDAVLNPQGLPPYTGPTGSVEGTITVTGPASPDVKVEGAQKCPAALDAYGKLFREGQPTTPGGPRPLADAVVVVVGFGENGHYVPEKNEAVRVTIGPNCAYPTRTLALTYGQRLEVMNDTSLLFGPMINDFDPVMVTPAHSTEPIKLYPTKAGFFMMTDRLQSFSRENLYVFRHPLHAVSDRAGHYRIDGIPPGKLEVGVYHPAIHAQATSPVTIEEGVVAKVDLTLEYKAPPPSRPKLAPDGGALPAWMHENE